MVQKLAQTSPRNIKVQLNILTGEREKERAEVAAFLFVKKKTTREKEKEAQKCM